TSNQGGNSRNGTQVVGNVHNATFHHGEGNNNAQHHQNPYGKLTRLDFPRFNGDDGEESATALIWHLHFVKRFGKNVPWELYETEILRRFGDVYNDLLVELKILKQSGDVQSYQDKFEMLLNKVDLTESHVVSIFMTGLKSEIGIPLRMFMPVTVHPIFFTDTFIALMDENTVCLLLKNHQDAMEKLAQQQVMDFQALFDTLRAELQTTRGVLQNRQGAGVIKVYGKCQIRFGLSKYKDPKGALSKLLQLGTLEDYQQEFEKLMNRVTDIPDSLLISFNISGLKLNLQHELLVSRPTTLGDAFSLARITEAHLEVIAKKEQNIIEKADTTLSLSIKEVSPVVKGLLDASEDTLLSLRSKDLNFKIQEKAVEYVRALNVAPLKVVFT
ncbi:class II heat shock protein, partial [Tanacetum coccineum]